MEQVEVQISDEASTGREFGYEAAQIKDASGKLVYDRPAIEELIRWRLWDRTGAGLMAELGSHQLDAAGIFIHAMHRPTTPRPRSRIRFRWPRRRTGRVPARPRRRGPRLLHLEFPAPGYDAKDPIAWRKKIGVQYSSINGNGFGGYGEIVFGTKGR